MSAKLLSMAASLERHDSLHEARLLVLLLSTAHRQPVDGIMKLAKMDFLLRYPNILERALLDVGRTKPSARRAAARLPEEVKDTVEAKMIRFRYGPWDMRYRRWLAIMAAKRLVVVRKQGRTIKVSPTELGLAIARQLTSRPEFGDLAHRADLVALAVGKMSATALKQYVYRIAPEIVQMKWGDSISL